jgi:hypothetical protein
MLESEGLFVRRVLLVSLVLLAAAVQAVRPEAELVLQDGTVIRGADVRREGDLYVLALESGEMLSFPVALVDEVRLGGRGEGSAPAPGVRRGESETLAGSRPDEDAPSGLRRGEPQTLAGTEVRPPRPSEQTRVLGPAAKFQDDIVDSNWTPQSDWDTNPSNNNFAPSTWAEAPVDSEWKPQSAFDADNDVLEPGRSGWQESIVDSQWQPQDAFAN